MTEVKTFAIDALERAGKSIGQGVVAGLALVLPSVDGAHLMSGSWWAQVLVAAGVGGVMGLASLVTSIGSAARTGTASLSRTVAGTVVVAAAQWTDEQIAAASTELLHPAANPVPVTTPAEAAPVAPDTAPEPAPVA